MNAALEAASDFAPIQVLGCMAILWGVASIEEKAGALLQLAHNDSVATVKKKPFIGPRKIAPMFDLLFQLAIEHVQEQAVATGKGDFQPKDDTILRYKKGDAATYKHAKSALVAGQVDDEDPEKTGIINLIFDTDSHLRDEDFIGRCKADTKVHWIFAPHRIRNRMKSLLEMENVAAQVALADME